MKIHFVIFLTLLVSASFVHTLSVRSILDSASSLFQWKTPHENDPENDCSVHKFTSVDKIDPTKLSGDWYEIARTITKKPIFSSGLWRFNSVKNPDQDAFFFSARLENGKCFGPITGSAISSNTNPGTFVLAYDGLKSKVEEELKVIYADYANAIVLYGCRRLTSTGTCLADATFVSILAKHKHLPESVLDPVYAAIQSICIDPHTLLPQDTSIACVFEDLIDMEWKHSEPVCSKPAACTIACPRCCTEDEEGCIFCDCGVKDSHQPSLCKKDASECGAGCLLTEKHVGCKVCDCSLQKMAAPVGPIDDKQMWKIGNYRECPTSCRTPKIEDQLYCNCTNERICRTAMPHVNCQGVVELYSFDIRTGTCPAYLGHCEDAVNSYTSVKECLSTCSEVCELHPDSGPCNGNEKRYYFNRVQGKCVNFVYGGCDGNENNFETQAECELRCPISTNEQGLNLEKLDKLCKLPEDKGTCNNRQLRYFYVLEADTCVPFHFGGCGGNDNNFETIEECEAKCNRKILQTDPKCSDAVEVCDYPCVGKINSAGCIECDCSNSANALSASMNGFIAFIIFMWLAY